MWIEERCAFHHRHSDAFNLMFIAHNVVVVKHGAGMVSEGEDATEEAEEYGTLTRQRPQCMLRR